MFSLFEITTFGIIIVLLIFIIVFFQIHKSITRNDIYLRSALLILLIILVSEELIFTKQHSVIIWVYPFILGGYLFIYPLIYFYCRDMVLRNDEKKLRVKAALAVPAAVILIISPVYYSLDNNSKITFLSLYLTGFSTEMLSYKIVIWLVASVYYLQTVFYLILTSKLISAAKKTMHLNTGKNLTVKYLIFYTAAVILYELSILILSLIITDLEKLRTTEQIITILFMSMVLYFAFRQSLLLVQAKFNIYSTKMDKEKISHQGKPLLAGSEKEEIKRAVENYFRDTKIYLDPNLRIEVLSKKIHITVRRISMVINEVYGQNFNHFINEYRITEAKRIIEQKHTDIKIDQVYTKVGFNSRSAFNNAFKEITGLTPIEYIKELTAIAKPAVK